MRCGVNKFERQCWFLTGFAGNIQFVQLILYNAASVAPSGWHTHRKWNLIFARAKQHTDDRDQTLVKLLLYDQFMMPRFMFEEVERYRFLNVVNVNVKILKIWSLILRLQTLNLRSGKAILGTYDRIQLPETGSISTISRSRSITVFDQLWNEHTNPIKFEAWRNFC